MRVADREYKQEQGLLSVYLIIYLPMNKTALFVVALLVLTQALTDKEIMQQGLNGVFDENKLSRPVTIVDCFDDNTAHEVVVFGSSILQKAANGTINDYIQIIAMSKDFIAKLPQPVKDCLGTNQELATLGLKYGIDSTTDPAVIEKKIATYAALHYLEVRKESNLINNLFQAGKYYDFGFEVAAYGHKVLNAPAPSLTEEQQ